jgi:WD40 repeat protein
MNSEEPELKLKGRFGWLYFLAFFLGLQDGFHLTNLAGWRINGILYNTVVTFLFVLPAYYIYSKVQTTDVPYDRSINYFQNLRRSWPKSARFLGLYTLFEIIIFVPLFAFTYNPCSTFDVIRAIDGCRASLKTEQQTSVQAVGFSKDGKILANAELTGAVKIWSYPGLELIKVIPVNASQIALSADGSLLAMCGYNRSVVLFETKTEKVLHTFTSGNDAACEIALSKDDTRLISLGKSTVDVWNIQAERLDRSFAHEKVEHFAVTANNSLLASADVRQIKVWRFADGASLFTVEQSYIQAIAFTPDEKYLVAATSDSQPSPTGKYSFNSSINFWSTADGALVRTITIQNALITHLEISPDSQTLVTGDGLCNKVGILEQQCTIL